ncbi:MAG TPA: hypothetical protein VIK33_00595 [Anaerolineae bacterium]
MQTVKVKGSTLTLPSEAMRLIKPADEFTIIVAGDTIILKRVSPTRLSDIALRAPRDKGMALNDISREVHRYRRGRRARRR